MYIIIQNMSIYIDWFLSFVKFIFDIKKIVVTIRRGKIIKRIIFALFLLQKIKFEEMTKNYPYKIIYF